MPKKRPTEVAPPQAPRRVEPFLWIGLIILSLTRLPQYESFGVIMALDILFMCGASGLLVRWFWDEHKYRKFQQAEKLADAPERPPWA